MDFLAVSVGRRRATGFFGVGLRADTIHLDSGVLLILQRPTGHVNSIPPNDKHIPNAPQTPQILKSAKIVK